MDISDSAWCCDDYAYGLVTLWVLQVEWGRPTMIQAERLLLREALQDPLNERFILLSDRYVVDSSFTKFLEWLNSLACFCNSRPVITFMQFIYVPLNKSYSKKWELILIPKLLDTIKLWATWFSRIDCLLTISWNVPYVCLAAAFPFTILDTSTTMWWPLRRASLTGTNTNQ